MIVNEFILVQPASAKRNKFIKTLIKTGDTVYDDIACVPAKVIRITKDEQGNYGIWLNNNYAGGAKHPWEISRI